jgi:hypothetical protein
MNIMEPDNQIPQQVYTKEGDARKNQKLKLLAASPRVKPDDNSQTLTRNSSFSKAVSEKPPKSVSFNMEPGNLDNIELIERKKKTVKNGNVHSKSRDASLIELGQKVDYVLVYEETNDLEQDELEKEEEKLRKREHFEEKLREKGLLLQHVDSDLNEVRTRYFLQIITIITLQ